MEVAILLSPIIRRVKVKFALPKKRFSLNILILRCFKWKFMYNLSYKNKKD